MQLALTLQVLDSKAAKGSANVRVLLSNSSDDKYYVNSRLLLNDESGPHELSFKIRAVSAGRARTPVHFAKKIRAPEQSSEFQWLRPGWFIGRTVDLIEYFNLKPGTYKVVAHYRNGCDPPPDSAVKVAWKGGLTSNPLTVSVK
jgi:hypothetical protein